MSGVLRLVLDTRDEDYEHAEEGLYYLLDELAQLDTESVEREWAGKAEPGTRGTGLDATAAVLIALGSSGATLPVLIGLVRNWLGRRGSGTVRLKIGSDEVELTHTSSAMQQRALDEFLGRHQGLFR